VSATDDPHLATAEQEPLGPPPVAPWRESWHYFLGNRGAVIGLVILSLLVLTAIFAPLLAPHDPTMQYRDALLVPPAWTAEGRASFPLGTDALGRDILSRLIYGARFSLVIGLVVVALALVTGILVGLIAGYYGGWIDAAVMRVMDIILAFPSLLLALVLVAIIGPGLFNAMLAIAVVLQPHFARLTRGAVIAEKNREYVTAAKVAGAGHLRLMVATILPNCLGPLIVQATLSFSNAILDAAALGFLGIGIKPPTSEWGTMVADGAKNIDSGEWWTWVFPGAAILMVVLAFNWVGDGLRNLFRSA
jgi:dipeptide transport system permease protein